jgi:hypothetical protein
METVNTVPSPPHFIATMVNHVIVARPSLIVTYVSQVLNVCNAIMTITWI